MKGFLKYMAVVIIVFLVYMAVMNFSDPSFGK